MLCYFRGITDTFYFFIYPWRKSTNFDTWMYDKVSRSRVQQFTYLSTFYQNTSSIPYTFDFHPSDQCYRILTEIIILLSQIHNNNKSPCVHCAIMLPLVDSSLHKYCYQIVKYYNDTTCSIFYVNVLDCLYKFFSESFITV